MAYRNLLIAPLALLAACGSEREGSFAGGDEAGNYSVSGDREDMRFRIEGAGGEVLSARSGTEVEPNLPAGFTIYPGAQVVSSTNISQGEGSGVLVVMQSADSPAKLIAHYRREAEAAGIEINSEVQSGNMQLLGGEGDEGRGFSFNVSPGDEGTVAQLVISERIGG